MTAETVRCCQKALVAAIGTLSLKGRTALVSFWVRDSSLTLCITGRADGEPHGEPDGEPDREPDRESYNLAHDG